MTLARSSRSSLEDGELRAPLELCKPPVGLERVDAVPQHRLDLDSGGADPRGPHLEVAHREVMPPHETVTQAEALERGGRDGGVKIAGEEARQQWMLWKKNLNVSREGFSKK